MFYNCFMVCASNRQKQTPFSLLYIRFTCLTPNSSFFDSLWIRSDIEKQNIIKQTYFKIFKEPLLKDENYRRKWFFEPTKKE